MNKKMYFFIGGVLLVIGLLYGVTRSIEKPPLPSKYKKFEVLKQNALDAIISGDGRFFRYLLSNGGFSEALLRQSIAPSLNLVRDGKAHLLGIREKDFEEGRGGGRRYFEMKGQYYSWKYAPKKILIIDFVSKKDFTYWYLSIPLAFEEGYWQFISVQPVHNQDGIDYNKKYSMNLEQGRNLSCLSGFSLVRIDGISRDPQPDTNRGTLRDLLSSFMEKGERFNSKSILFNSCDYIFEWKNESNVKTSEIFKELERIFKITIKKNSDIMQDGYKVTFPEQFSSLIRIHQADNQQKTVSKNKDIHHLNSVSASDFIEKISLKSEILFVLEKGPSEILDIDYWASSQDWSTIQYWLRDNGFKLKSEKILITLWQIEDL